MYINLLNNQYTMLLSNYHISFVERWLVAPTEQKFQHELSISSGSWPLTACSAPTKSYISILATFPQGKNSTRHRHLSVFPKTYSNFATQQFRNCQSIFHCTLYTVLLLHTSSPLTCPCSFLAKSNTGRSNQELMNLHTNSASLPLSCVGNQ